MPAPHDLLRQLFDAAIAAAMPDKCIPQHLPPPPKGRLIVIGAGKASAAMARAVEKNWPGKLSGLVVTRYGYAVPCEHIEIVESAHPVPDAAGETAARRMLELVRGLSPDDPGAVPDFRRWIFAAAFAVARPDAGRQAVGQPCPAQVGRQHQ